MSIPYINTFFGSGQSHYARTIQGIWRQWSWSGLHYLALSRRVLRERYHIFWRWSDFYYPTRDTRRIPSLSDWASRSIVRVGIAYLVCFACLCYFPLYLYFLFASSICFPRNNKKEHFPFIIIRHELCFPPTHNPLLKYSAYYLGKFLHLSLFAFLWICVCILSYVSLYMFHFIGYVLIPKWVHRPFAITRAWMMWMRQ